MNRVRLGVLIAFISTCAHSAEWLTNGGDPQRTNWQRDEHILSPANVKDLKLLWKFKLDNQPREMHSLFPPLLVTGIPTSTGARDMAIEAGISDNIFAIDVNAGTLIWKKHFEYPPPREGEGLQAGDPLCPGGQTASPVIGPADDKGARTLYALDGDGQLHFLNVADGEETRPAVKFSFANAKAYALNLWNGVIYTTTSQSCNGSPE